MRDGIECTWTSLRRLSGSTTLQRELLERNCCLILQLFGEGAKGEERRMEDQEEGSRDPIRGTKRGCSLPLICFAQKLMKAATLTQTSVCYRHLKGQAAAKELGIVDWRGGEGRVGSKVKKCGGEARQVESEVGERQQLCSPRG